MEQHLLSLPKALRVVLVDHAAADRAALRYSLEQFSNVSIVGETSSASEALRVFDEEPVDVAIAAADLAMGSSFALIRDLAERSRPIASILVANDAQGALHAFDAGAVDYILTPFGLARLKKALVQACKLSASRPSSVTRLAVRNRQSYVVIRVEDIIYFEARDRFVWAVTKAGRHALEMTFAEVESMLQPEQFFRSHRSVLVRMDAIKEVLCTKTGRYEITLAHPGTPRVPLSRHRFRDLRTRIAFPR